MPTAGLKPGRDKSLRRRHPWIFSGAIASVRGALESGATVAIESAEGESLAIAAWSPHSQIRARVWSFEPVAVDAAFIRDRVQRAVAARERWFDAQHSGGRLVYAESDGLPGVIVDRYGDVVVLQLSSAGADKWRDAIVDALSEMTGANTIVERSDAEVRSLEGLAPRCEVLRGRVDGPVEFVEAGIEYGVDVIGGQKTGFYLDQRDNRRIVGSLAEGRDVLNVFCYTGGFSLAALAGGATRVVSMDSSQDALALARANLARNASLDRSRATWLEGDAFAELRKLRNVGEAFDIIVLDPPKFAPTAQHAERAARAYKDINLSAFRLLRPGGILATFSCSGGVTAELFQKIIAGAALDAQVDSVILAKLSASADHPVALAFPEGEYLKGLLLRKV
ncbi:MAG TPA: class I SAM-dependent rRNA methyltransferase [Casimicrobiaceae bacterium]|nr:class I SAM-dependent rRNA methyltransferase [Casimicrobiaceae bacterium]